MPDIETVECTDCSTSCKCSQLGHNARCSCDSCSHFDGINTEFLVPSLSCSGCVKTVTEALLAVSHIQTVSVDLDTKRVTITDDGISPSISKCLVALRAAGYPGVRVYPQVPHADVAIEKVSNRKKISIDLGTESLEVSVLRSEFSVDGMTCATCVNTIEKLIAPIPGIKSISVNLIAKKAIVEHVPDRISPEQVAEKISDVGYPAAVIQKANAPGLLTFNFTSPSSTSTPVITALVDTKVIDAVQTMPGVKSVTKLHDTTVSSPLLSIEFDVSSTSGRRILAYLRSLVEDQGIEVSLFKPQAGSADALRRAEEIAHYKRHFLISLFFAVPIFIIGMLLMWIEPAKHKMMMVKVVRGVNISGFLQFFIATPVQFWLGATFYKHAWISLRRLRPTMDLLICLGTSAAYFYSVIVLILQLVTPTFESEYYFEVAVILICFVLLGRFLENKSKGKTSEAIVKLMNLQATTAIIVDFDSEKGEVVGDIEGEVVDTDLVQVGDVIRVVPGASVPVDGVVVSGNSNVNEAMITGESMPQKKSVGSPVIGGTLNLNSALLVRATQVGSDTALSKIVQLVEEAQSQKPEIQKMTDRLSGIFVPIVVVIAIVDFAIWMLVLRFATIPEGYIPSTTSPFVFSLLLAISVLVIACPCGLGLAAPSALMVGSGLAAKFNILIKGGLALEKAHKINVILFDKTGTLTIGKPTVNVAKILRDQKTGKRLISKPEFYAILASAESNSEHPLGKAIFSFAKDKLDQHGNNDSWPNIVQPKRFKAIPGHGISCKLNTGENKRSTILIGNRALMSDNGMTISASLESIFEQYESEGKTLMLVAFDGALVGYVTVSDPLRPEAFYVAEELRRRNIRMGIVSGDNVRTVNHIAAQLNVQDLVFSQVLPKDKKSIVEKCQAAEKGNNVVAFVGDGINDSPALAQSDVGIAIGTGTDVAIEAASIVLMRSDLRDILVMIDVVRKTYNRIRWNLFFAFVYNAIGIPLAAGVLYPAVRIALPPWFAGLAMALSSVSVVVSSLLLGTYKPSSRKAIEKEGLSTNESPSGHAITI